MTSFGEEKRVVIRIKSAEFGEERVTPVAWLKAKLGVPEHATYLGFGVQKEGGALFLAVCDPAAAPSDWGWTPSVEQARKFVGWREALDASERCAGSGVVLYFDYGEEIWVFPAR